MAGQELDFEKRLEVYFTFMIEKIWGKKRILQMYLNVSEMGKGVFGIDAAAKFYFGKHAKDLNRSEAAMIAGCLAQSKSFYYQTHVQACGYQDIPGF